MTNEATTMPVHSHTWLMHPSHPILGCECGAVATVNGYVLKPRRDKDGYHLVDCGPKGARKTLRVHRVIAACVHGESELEVDHRNRDRTDNRASNLRYLSIEDNRRNVGPHTDSASQIRGVRYRKDRDNWQAYKHRDGHFISLGHFATAAKAEAIAREHYHVG